MKHKNIIFLIFIGILLNNSLQIYGQRNFQQGYIVTNFGDTISGKLKDRAGKMSVKLYKKIKFKPNTGFRRKLSPNDIRVYKIGNQKFTTMDVYDEIIFFKRKVYEIPDSGNKQFIKVIAEGYLCWYEKEYVDDSGLSAITYFKRVDENKMIFVRTGFFGLNKQSLARYFKDCSELAKKILSKTIHTPSEVFEFYNKQCRNHSK